MNTQILSESLKTYFTENPWIILLIIWTMIWKIIALWKAAKNDQLTIFIVLSILNTAGIAEIAYILYLYIRDRNNKEITIS